MRVVKPMMLWMLSVVLFVLASIALELIEGYKITTTEYYGLQNIGFAYVAVQFLLSVILYPIILGPISWITQKIEPGVIGALILILLWGVGGYAVFHRSYQDRFVEEYGLSSVTAILLFGLAGMMYALAEFFLEKKRKERTVA